MYSLEEELDAFVAASAAPQRPSHGNCGCASCRTAAAPPPRVHGGCGCATCRADEAAPRRRPRGAPGQTPPRAVGTQLPAWRGWTRAQPLSAILAARAAAMHGQPVAPALRPFVARGPSIYRLTRQGIDRARALNIGLTAGRASIADRVMAHHRQPSRGDPPVYERIAHLPAERIMVQAAMLDPRRMQPREAKAYENWLQIRERPLLYQPSTTTFESAGHRHYT